MSIRISTVYLLQVNSKRVSYFEAFRLNKANTDTINLQKPFITMKSNKINDILGSDRQARTIPC